MKTGDYDVVSASGDASLRLIAAGDVAPVNTDLLRTTPTSTTFLKDREWNSVDGQMYGVPHGWGANLLMWRTDVVKAAPTSWSAVFEARSPYAGQGHGLRLADLHRRRRAVPDEHPARPGDREPLRARRGPARRRPSTCSRPRRRWSASTGRTTSRRSRPSQTGDSVIGTTWQVIANVPRREKVPVEAMLPEEGVDRLVGHLDGRRGLAEHQLRLRLDGPHHQPGGQRRRGGVLRGGAGQRQGVRPHRRQEPLRHLPRRGRGLRREDLVLDHADRGVPRRAHRRDVHRLRRWTQAWTEVKG